MLSKIDDKWRSTCVVVAGVLSAKKVTKFDKIMKSLPDDLKVTDFLISGKDHVVIGCLSRMIEEGYVTKTEKPWREASYKLTNRVEQPSN